MNFDTRVSTVYLHIHDLYREAEEYRMAKLTRADHPSFTDRMFARLGDVLIAFGASLKERAERRMNQMVTQEMPIAKRMQL